MHFNTAFLPLRINHAFHDCLLSNLIRSLVTYSFADKALILHKRSAFFRACIVILPHLLFFGNSLKYICTKAEDKIHSWKYIAIYIYFSFYEQEEF